MDHEQASDFLAEHVLGGRPNMDTVEQFMTMMECVVIHHERSRKYGQAWRKYGALNNLLRLASKVERLIEQFWRSRFSDGAPAIDLHNPDLDDAYDAVNYAVFMIRQGKAGQWTKDG